MPRYPAPSPSSPPPDDSSSPYASWRQGDSLTPREPITLPESLNPFLQDYASFMVPASDVRGHSADVRFKALEAMWAQSEAVLRQGIWPYDSVPAIIRHGWAIILEMLSEVIPIDPSLLYQMREMIATSRRRLYWEQFGAVLEEMEARCRFFAEEGLWEERIEYLWDQRMLLMTAPDGGWEGKMKKLFLRRFDRRWGRYLGIHLPDMGGDPGQE